MRGSANTNVMHNYALSAEGRSDVAMRQHLEGGGAAQGRQDGRAQHHEVHACQAPRLCRRTHVSMTPAVTIWTY